MMNIFKICKKEDIRYLAEYFASFTSNQGYLNRRFLFGLKKVLPYYVVYKEEYKSYFKLSFAKGKVNYILWMNLFSKI